MPAFAAVLVAFRGVDADATALFEAIRAFACPVDTRGATGTWVPARSTVGVVALKVTAHVAAQRLTLLACAAAGKARALADAHHAARATMQVAARFHHAAAHTQLLSWRAAVGTVAVRTYLARRACLAAAAAMADVRAGVHTEAGAEL